MSGTPDTSPGQGRVEYDPQKHQGLLHVGGRDIIIADAKQAKLQELPEKVKETLAKETAAQLALMDFSRGVGGVIIQITNESRAEELQKGYLDGLRELGYTYDTQHNTLKKD